MKEQVIGQNGINLNYELKKVSIMPDDLIIIKTDLYESESLQVCEEIQNLYPNNRIAVMKKDIIDLQSMNLESFYNEIKNEIIDRGLNIDLKDEDTLMKQIKVNIGDIPMEIVIENTGEYPSITILENDNPICFVEVNHIDKNIATVSYNDSDDDDDYANKTIFKKIE